MVRFGVAGNPDNFYAEKNKSSYQMPKWLKEKGLDAYEYQFGKGVRITEKTALEIKGEAEKNEIYLTAHSPYFISLSSVEEEKRIKSVDYIMQTMRAANLMGAKRIVVHSGSCSKISRQEALSLAKDTLRLALDEVKKENLEHIMICPETMGKINQLGTVDEVIELCRADEIFIPCIDFGHINARELGSLKCAEDFEKICLKITDGLGEYRGKNFHCHFTRIAFTEGGEKKHIPYSDTSFGPEFDPFAEVIVKYGLSPVIICESPGTQDSDALTYKNILEAVTGERK